MVFADMKQHGNRIIITFDGFPQNDTEYMSAIQLVKNIYDKKERFIILYDARKIGWLSWKRIKMQADFMKSQEEFTKKYMVRAAVIVNSVAARAILNTLFGLRKPAAPCKIFTDIEGGKQYLKEAGLRQSIQ